MSWTLDALLPTLDAPSSVATLDGSGGTVASAAAFTWAHSYGSPRKTKFSLSTAKFGDGYQQRVGTGINNIMQTWDLRFIGKSESVAQAIVSFLEARSEGLSFDWTPLFLNPNSQAIRVICKEYDVNPSTHGAFDISATFEQVYGE